VRSVISLGVGGQTQGAWSVPSKAFAYFGSTEGRAYSVAYGCAFFIENVFRARSVYCPPDMDPEGGARIPLQSLKLHAELAGIGCLLRARARPFRWLRAANETSPPRRARPV